MKVYCDPQLSWIPHWTDQWQALISNFQFWISKQKIFDALCLFLSCETLEGQPPLYPPCIIEEITATNSTLMNANWQILSFWVLFMETRNLSRTAGVLIKHLYFSGVLVKKWTLLMFASYGSLTYIVIFGRLSICCYIPMSNAAENKQIHYIKLALSIRLCRECLELTARQLGYSTVNLTFIFKGLNVNFQQDKKNFELCFGFNALHSQ